MNRTVEVPSWTGRLRAAGLRVTQPRLAVLDVVHQDPHASADQVAARVRAEIGSVSTQAVYDTLNTLTEHDILRRFEPAGSAMRFEIATGDNHHHLVCRGCQRVLDVPCAMGSIPCAVPEDPQGFVVEEAEVTYWGTCADCAASRSDPTGEPSAVEGPATAVSSPVTKSQVGNP
ncbi:MAG: Fur family transcriptional regulator [Friedmanniella sp.]|nr:Fur family transcriptional regulator [Friedmanniella sp.]